MNRVLANRYEVLPTTAELTDEPTDGSSAPTGTALYACRSHLRIIHETEDTDIVAALHAALERFTATTNRQLFNRSFRLALEAFPYLDTCLLYIPRPPLRQITAIEYTDTQVDEFTYEINPTINVNPSTDNITINDHGLANDDRLVYSTLGGTAIDPLVDGTTYFAIVVDTNTIQLAASAGGAAIDIADQTLPDQTQQLYRTTQKPWDELNQWKINTNWEPGWIEPVTNGRYPDHATLPLIDFDAGYGTSWGDIPVDYQRCILLLVEHYFENRQPIGDGGEQLPETLQTLLNQCTVGDEFFNYGTDPVYYQWPGYV